MATYTKLKSGDWGVRGDGQPPAPGTPVNVRKASGEIKSETIGRIVWQGSDTRTGQPAWLAAVTRAAAPASTSNQDRPRRNWRPCGYPGCRPNYCDECDGEGYRAGR